MKKQLLESEVKTMRERLIELLSGKSIDTYADVKYVADYLLANGVIALPCKVGDTLYALKENEKIVKCTAVSILQNLVGKERDRWIVTSRFENYYSKIASFECETYLYSSFDDFGKTVFFTREEAEKALAERMKDND